MSNRSGASQREGTQTLRGAASEPQTPLASGDYRGEIESTTLPPVVERHVERYESIGGGRDRFVWKWVATQLGQFRLPTVPDEQRDATRAVKLLLTLYVTTTDDTVEVHGDRATFEYARRLTGSVGDASVPSEADERRVAFLETLWEAIDERLQATPRHDEFRELFEYDLRQVYNAIDYSRVFNAHPGVATLDELRRYDAHNMVVFPYAGIDLMASSSFRRTDLGPLRALLWELQVMARIGNWLSTWEREVSEGDYASGVVARAIERGILEPVERAESPPESVRARVAAHDLEAELLAEWDRTRGLARTKADRIDCFDADGLVEGMIEVFHHHLASVGLK